MKLTKKDEQAAVAAYWNRFPIGQKPSSIDAFLAAVEWKQDELQKVVDAENTKLQEELERWKNPQEGVTSG